MPECTRSFIAIAVPVHVEQQLAQLQAELVPKFAGCRWNSTRPLHMTLAFLGDVPTGDLTEICHDVAATAESLDRFDVEVRGLGAFPNAMRPRVIWAGVFATNGNALNELQQAVLGSLVRIGRGPDDPRFHPHVTIGRIKDERRDNRALRALIESRDGWSAGRFTVTDLVVMSSTLGPSGPRYEILGRGLLAGKKP
jgi:RNA 2',3'-cyclic 3'-phosphodiesterase